MKRVAYIDLAKGIGMVLVLCGHLQNDTIFALSPHIQGFCKWIFSFHMPMFFIISGMLFAAKGEIPPMKDFFKKRFSTIMVPYYLFTVIYFLIILYGVFISHSMNITDMFVQLWYAVSLYGINVLWFLPALFIAEMIFALIMKKFDGKKRWIAVLIMTMAALGVNEIRGYIPENPAVYVRLNEIIVMLLRPVIACSFISIGYLFEMTGGRFCCHLFSKKLSAEPSPCHLLTAVIFFAVNIAVVRFNSPTDLRSLVLNNYLLYYIGAVAGSGFIILMCRMVMSLSKSGKAFPVTRFWGRNSLLFMAVHNNPAVWIASLYAAMFVNKFVTRARGYVSYVVIVVCFLIYVSVMILLINRFLSVLAHQKN
ncbi:MAG: acyltransferase family protein [Lachnospiraceae bacterium]|nr:acyltransferase family protein [Lachnospiraceae bacterium]